MRVILREVERENNVHNPDTKLSIIIIAYLSFYHLSILSLLLIFDFTFK